MFFNKKIICFGLLILATPLFSKTTSHDFWKTVKKGANIFNKEISRKDIQEAKKYGIQFIRLAPDKFFTKNRDFLIGNADRYEGLDQKDLEKLKKI